MPAPRAAQRPRRHLDWQPASAVIVIFVLFMGAGCAASNGRPSTAPSSAASASDLERLECIAPQMGMQARIVLYAADRERGKQAADAAMTEISRLDQTLSDWRDDSETAMVNRAAGGEPVRISATFIDALQRAQEVSRWSEGAFDVTIGPLTQLWRAAKTSGRAPSDADIHAARALVNWHDIDIDAVAGTVRLRHPGMRLDFGGIGKGFAADRALEILREHGIRIALVALEGDIALGDSPPGATGWTIAIDDGLSGAAPAPSLALHNCGISTSGDAEQFLLADGQHASHIINPRDGLGLTARIAVTVIARDDTAADALATAASVMGVERGLQMIDHIDGAVARIVTTDATGTRVQASGAFPR